MAASTREHDFVHRLSAKLEEAGVTVDLRFGNVADFERNPAETDRAYFEDDFAFAPDVVVLRICENTPADKYAEFAAAYEALIRSFRANPCCTVFAVGPFWENGTMETLLHEASDKGGAVWLSLSSLHGDLSCQATGQYEHAGVASHPSDRGMEAIADIIFGGIKEAGLLA
jgi:hypothetical protein